MSSNMKGARDGGLGGAEDKKCRQHVEAHDGEIVERIGLMAFDTTLPRL